jgi:hypothetical protein
MQFLLLYKADSSLFDRSEVEHVFRSDPRFKDLRFDTPGGDLIECEYVETDDRTIVNLDNDRQAIFLSHTWGAALRAVLVIHKSLGIPLRLINDDYTFDLTFSDISTVEELETAMDHARTS